MVVVTAVVFAEAAAVPHSIAATQQSGSLQFPVPREMGLREPRRS